MTIIPTYVPLATVTLESAQQSVTFSSIPNTYRDLVLVSEGGASQNSYTGIQFNNDTGTNYWGVDARYEVNGTFTTAAANIWIPQRFTGSGRNIAIFEIINYSTPSRYTTVLLRSGSDTQGVSMTAAVWKNTTPVSTITVDVEGTRTWNSGSIFSLYGIHGEV